MARTTAAVVSDGQQSSSQPAMQPTSDQFAVIETMPTAPAMSYADNGPTTTAGLGQ